MGIIKIVEWAFGGFACMFFPMIAALYWKRCGKGPVITSILISQCINIFLPLLVPQAKMPLGMLPAFWSIVGGAVVLFIGGYIAPAQDTQKADAFLTFSK